MFVKKACTKFYETPTKWSLILRQGQTVGQTDGRTWSPVRPFCFLFRKRTPGNHKDLQPEQPIFFVFPCSGNLYRSKWYSPTVQYIVLLIIYSTRWCIDRSWGSVVGIRTRLWTGRFETRIPAGAKRFLSSPKRPDRLWEPSSLHFNEYPGS